MHRSLLYLNLASTRVRVLRVVELDRCMVFMLVSYSLTCVRATWIPTIGSASLNLSFRVVCSNDLVVVNLVVFYFVQRSNYLKFFK